MPRRKKEKHPKDMTTEELAREVFPPEVLERLKEIAHENDQRIEAPPQQSQNQDIR
jgi:hypothetical protein